MNKTPTLIYCAWLIRDSGWAELCHVSKGIAPTWHGDSELMVQAARKLARDGNLYVTLNRLDKDAVDAYRGEARRAGRIGRTCDEHITRYTRILFDFDPQRSTDTSSTDAELQDAKVRAMDCIALFHSLGWPRPALAMSGNGWHLQYRTALPNTAEFREILSVIYAELHDRFSDDVVSFDRSVRNPARLCTLYGSVKRKGQNTPERPHRQSWIALPPTWAQVLPKQVEAVASQWAKNAPVRRSEPRRSSCNVNGKGDYRSLDVVAWFRSRDLYLGHSKDRIHRALCPWRDEHTTNHDGGTIVFEADDGWPGFYCKHAHCDGRDIRDVMSLWGDADQFCSQMYRHSDD